MNKHLALLFAALILISCKQKRTAADLILYNACVYTTDSTFSVAEAFAVSQGKIVEVNTSKNILEKYEAKDKIDAGGKAVYPGFIDGQSHFYKYGKQLKTVDLRGVPGWNEIVQKVKVFAEVNPGGWILGWGWDQNVLRDRESPDNSLLNKLFAGRPVLLFSLDGHMAIANKAALDSAKIKPSQLIQGGEIETTGKGVLTGILLDNAVDLVSSKIPAPSITELNSSLLAAQSDYLAAGLTSVTEWGLNYPMISVIDALQQSNRLKMRIYLMLSDRQRNYDYLFKNGAYKTARLNVRSFSINADGALGSRGACLSEPYSDKAGYSGLLLSEKKHFEEVARQIFDKGFQMNSQATGDSANRVILNIYAGVLKGKNDRRWRIGQAQVLNPLDLNLFSENSIIPSVQPAQAISDRYWAVRRLGYKRLKYTYAYKNLLRQNGWIILGSDSPAGNINPLLTFYAAVNRKDMQGRFRPDNAFSRQQALRGITIWAAKGNFEEKEKGSIEAGKYADFVILDNDIMKIPEQDILKNKVLKTYINGEKVYQNND